MALKLGFVGAGVMAREHANAAKALGAEIVSVYSKGNRENVAKFSEIAPEVRFLEKRLDTDGIDKLVVAAPWDQMTDYTIMACEVLAMPVLLEKPIAVSASAIDRITVRNNRIMVGYNRRFYSTVEALRSRIRQGGLKSVDVVISEMIDEIVQRRGGNIVPHLIEFNSHTLDLVLHLFGPVEVAYLKQVPDRGIKFTSIDAMLVDGKGTPIHLALNANDPSPVGIRCRFADGETWVLSPLETLTVFKGTSVTMDEERHIRRYQPREINQIRERSRFKPGVFEQMDAFLSGNFGPGCTMMEAIKIHKLIRDLRQTS